MLRTVITTACICVSGVAWGESRNLTGSELKDLVSAGATVELDAPMGYKIPIRYGADGHMTGEAGGLASYLGAATGEFPFACLIPGHREAGMAGTIVVR